MIFFDMDGVLIDSEKIYNICWNTAAKQLGYILTEEQVLYLRSLDGILACEFLTKIFSDENAYSAIRMRRKEIMLEYLKKEQLKAKPGVKELMSYLNRKKVNTAVVTSASIDRAERYLDSAGIKQYFFNIVSTEQVKRGKPYPDVYRYACKVLGVEPTECIAVEDSPNGLKSASLAGCKTIMIPDLSQYDEKVKPYVNWHFDCLTDIISSGIV